MGLVAPSTDRIRRGGRRMNLWPYENEDCGCVIKYIDSDEWIIEWICPDCKAVEEE